MSGFDRTTLKALTVEELERLIAEREERIRPVQEEIKALRRTRAAKLGRAARAATESDDIEREEAQVARLREQLGGGRGIIPELIKQTGLKERTVYRRLDPWRVKQPRRH